MIRTFLVRVLLATFAGVLITLWLLQSDPRFQRVMEKKLTVVLERMLDCKVSGTLVGLNIFHPTIVIKNAHASSKQAGEWQWKCKQCTFQFSYLELLGLGKLAMRIHLEELQATSLYVDGALPISAHLKRLVAYQKDMPLSLKKLLVTNGQFTAHTADNATQLKLAFKSEAGTVGNRFKASMYLTDGALVQNDIIVAYGFTGSLGLDMQKKAEQSRVTAFMDILVTLPQLPADDQQCSLRARWKDRHGQIVLCNKQGTCAIKQGDISVSPSGQLRATLRAIFPLSYWFAVYTGTEPSEHVRGQCTATAVLKDNQQLHASLRVDDGGWRSLSLDHVQSDLKCQDGKWQAMLHVHDTLLGKLQGAGSWDEKEQQGKLSLENSTGMHVAPLRHWTVLPHDIQLNATFDGSGRLTGEFHAKAAHKKLEQLATIAGSVQIDDSQFILTGSVNDKPFEADISLAPTFQVNSLQFTDPQGKPLISVKTGSDDHTTVQGILTFPFLQLLLHNSLGYDIRGQGDLQVRAALKDQILYGQLLLPDGNIRLASTHNFIQQARVPVQLDLVRKQCVVRGAEMKLHKGTIRCKRATVQYDDHNHITFAHLPLLLNKVFVNVGKDMFAIVSGYVVLEYRQNAMPILRGTIVIERAQLKKNILSGSVQRSLLRELSNTLLGSEADIMFDVRILNRHPLQVRTAFLHTDLDIKLHCTGQFSSPRVVGAITLSNGSLKFPYRQLHVVNGTLYFQPPQLDDPRIELTAKGNVRRYTVTMQVGGTLRHPNINFSSSPSLDEEQIITLLLAGSEEGSLSLVMPSLIMQNVQNLIFGSEHGASTIDTYVNNVLAPFKHIRIVPSFSDQTGRGGFRGAIEIDVSERLHAVIQKNFSLTEDTRVEVEYRLSDDFNVRGIKDERGDIGGEIETRFSF